MSPDVITGKQHLLTNSLGNDLVRDGLEPLRFVVLGGHKVTFSGLLGLKHREPEISVGFIMTQTNPAQVQS